MSAYISEVQYSTDEDDFIEVAVAAGTDLSGYTLIIYSSNGTITPGDDGAAIFSLGSVQSTNVGKDVYLVDPGEDMLSGSHAIALVDDSGTVLQFISFNGNTVSATEGAASGQTSTNVGSASGSSTLQSGDGSSYAAAPQSPGTIPCFTRGCRILTPDGEVPVECLSVGDLVVTLDHGAQPIRYLARAELCGPDIPEPRKPVLLAKGSIGGGVPKRDLTVSGQHCLLLRWQDAQVQFGVDEILVPAKGLLRLPGVRIKRGVRRVQYIHLLLDRHEVLFADGAATESLYPGPTIRRDISPKQRYALLNALTQVSGSGADGYGPRARLVLDVQQTRALVQMRQRRLRLGHGGDGQNGPASPAQAMVSYRGKPAIDRQSRARDHRGTVR